MGESLWVVRDRSRTKVGMRSNAAPGGGNGLHLRYEKTGERMMCQLADLQAAESEEQAAGFR